MVKKVAVLLPSASLRTMSSAVEVYASSSPPARILCDLTNFAFGSGFSSTFAAAGLFSAGLSCASAGNTSIPIDSKAAPIFIGRLPPRMFDDCTSNVLDGLLRNGVSGGMSDVAVHRHGDHGGERAAHLRGARPGRWDGLLGQQATTRRSSAGSMKGAALNRVRSRAFGPRGRRS